MVLTFEGLQRGLRLRSGYKGDVGRLSTWSIGIKEVFNGSETIKEYRYVLIGLYPENGT